MAVCLQNFKGVDLRRSRKTQVTALHKFVFGIEGDRQNRQRLREFQGFDYDQSDQEFQRKLQYVNSNLSHSELTSICILLDLSPVTDDQTAYIFENLRKGQLLKDAVGDEEDDTEADDEDDEVENTIVVNERSDVNCESDYENVSNDEGSYVAAGSRELSTAITGKNNNEFQRNGNISRSAFNFKDVEELFEKFTGDGHQSIQRWISDLEDGVILYNWNDLETVTFARRLLQGSARRFVNYEKCGSTWLKLKKALVQEFGEAVDSKKVHSELGKRKIKAGETYNDYIYIMMEIAGQCGIERRAVFQYIIEGIPDEPENKVILRGARTVKELKEKFQEYDNMKKERGMKNKAKKEESYIKKKSTADGTFPVRRCFNCGGQDHVGATCPSKAKGLKCFKCNEFGHIAAKCESKSRDACLISHTGKRYETQVLLANKISTAVIDTGSELSLIRSDEYRNIGSPKLVDRKITFEGVGSKSNKTLGELTASVKINDVEVDVKLHVVDPAILKHKVILGTNFIDQIELNIKNGVMIFSKLREKKEVEEIPFIYNIDVQEHDGEDLSHISCPIIRSNVADIIKQYNPQKIKDVGVETRIILKDETPVAFRPRRLAQSEKEEVDKQVRSWLDEGIIRSSNSEFASPIVLVKKKNGTTRICVDYRGVNKSIVRPHFPLPLIEDQLDALQGAKVFTLIDLKNGFFHVRIARGSEKYTAFVTPTGHYEFLKTPFGLAVSPIIFQKFINAVFKELIERKIVVTYMDDLIILASSESEAVERAKMTLDVAAQHGLQINWHKCCFLKTEVEYLGYIVSNSTIKPSEHKTKAVANFPMPTNAKKVQSFLGLTGYFRKFIPQYSIVARPLTNLLKNDVPFKFAERENESFESLKKALVEVPVLRLYKVGAETQLHTDACRYGYGMILMQKDDEDQKFHPVYYASGKTTPAEENYSSYELEVLAIVKALKKFRVYLLGIKFLIITDCQAFEMTMKKKDLSVRVARWVLLLEEFSYEVRHRPGKNMAHVDALSRNPLPNVLLIAEGEGDLLNRVRNAQNKDDHLRGLIEANNKRNRTDFAIKNGILYKIVNDDYLIVVPKDDGMQTQIVRRAHEKGHFGIVKTEEIVKQDFWFEKLREKAEKIVANCLDCILAERKQGKQEGFLYPIGKGDTPLDTYHIDHLGPMTLTMKKYKYLFVVVDAFTKFVWLFPTKSTDAATVVECFQKMSNTFGNPKRIVSDRGAAFTSSLLKDYCTKEGIEHVLIVTGVPRSNGQVERINRTVIPLLTKLAAPQPENWYKHVSLAQKYLNNTKSRSTGSTPFKLMFGINMRLKEETNIKELLEELWSQTFEENRNELRRLAKENIEKMQENNRKSHNKNRKLSKKYEKGDFVAIKRTQFGPGLKLHGKYLGPYEVTHVMRNDRYAVQKKGQHEGPQQTSTSADFMKPWMSNNDD